ncbi:class I SAM-dependent methyltransferase [Mycobacterium sp. MYCO198283]|uniref:class I SAM-dependent methyltransferase n=1 Tax=Mycobacterium sp. MYCO198283 TaxID=2883505 RepID=UPI001E46172F|nr:class I SAM-dependent methyltransferase [Mycobacterium sp. MYCO198283]MCG5431511.1 class I SAM-dependent methyltransferase [Mycobacterium sp. MYCO198283]
MTDTAVQRFDAFYAHGTAPWVIGEPQPAIVALERDGHIRGKVLDIGCGTGEHSILLARAGYDVLGVDFAPHAVERARANAAARGVDVRFAVADALDLPGDMLFDTVVDSALFHVFGDADRRRYVRSLHSVTGPGGAVHVLALSDAGRGFGPQVSEAQIREAFGGRDWDIEELTTTSYRGVVTDLHAVALGLPVGTEVDEPAWLVRLRRR